jgi:hypothetical protein
MTTFKEAFETMPVAGRVIIILIITGLITGLILSV